MLVLTSETILKYFCPEGLLALTSESILEYFCPEGFAQSVHTCFDLRKYFRISLSGRVCSICSCLFCPQKVFQNIFVQESLLNPLMLVLSSETMLEYFCQEWFAHQSLKKFQLLKISI